MSEAVPLPYPVHLTFKPAPPNVDTPALDLLTPNRRMFVLHYVLGDDEVRGVAYKSYIAAGFTAANVNTASAASWQLLKDEKVRKAIKEIRSGMEEEFKLRIGSWTGTAIKAKELIERTIDTALDPTIPPDRQVRPSANALYAAKEALDRAFGRPKQPHTMETAGNLDELIKNLNTKLNQQRPHPQLGPGDPRFIGEVPPPVSGPSLVEDDDVHRR